MEALARFEFTACNPPGEGRSIWATFADAMSAAACGQVLCGDARLVAGISCARWRVCFGGPRYSLHARCWVRCNSIAGTSPCDSKRAVWRLRI